MPRINQCFKCNRTNCYFRIHTKDFDFDEVACQNHVIDLTLYAYNILGRYNGVMIEHISSSSELSREPRKKTKTKESEKS